MDKMQAEKHIIPGALYRHYKGDMYEVIDIARHTESLEVCVVYRALYNSPEFGDNALWIRPLDMFLETVNYQGEMVPRFQQVKNN